MKYYRLYCPGYDELGIAAPCHYWHHKDCGGDIYRFRCNSVLSEVWGIPPVLHLELGDLGGTSGLVPLADLIAMMVDMVYMTGNVWMAELLMNIEVSVKSILMQKLKLMNDLKL